MADADGLWSDGLRCRWSMVCVLWSMVYGSHGSEGRGGERRENKAKKKKTLGRIRMGVRVHRRREITLTFRGCSPLWFLLIAAIYRVGKASEGLPSKGRSRGPFRRCNSPVCTVPSRCRTRSLPGLYMVPYRSLNLISAPGVSITQGPGLPASLRVKVLARSLPSLHPVSTRCVLFPGSLNSFGLSPSPL